MSSQVNVRSVEAVENLKEAFNRFHVDTQEILQTAEQEIRNTEGWLQERLRYWQTEVQRRTEEVRRAEAALTRCEASGYRDPRTGAYYKPPCNMEKQALQQARSQLQEAQQRLNEVQTWIRLVGQAASAYRQQAQRTTRVISTQCPQGVSFLTSKIADLQTYLNSSASGGANSGPSAPSSPSQSVSGAYGSAPHLGIQMVPVDQIDLSDTWVTGPADFHKVSPETMKEGFQKLQDVVIPAVARGADGDYFARLDASLGLQYADGYQHIYDVFYGGDAIRLDLVGNQYKVTGGYHRLYIAQQLGIRQVPAKVGSVRP